MYSDTIADMLTRIRNAQTARHDVVDIPASTVKVSIAKILLEEGFIGNMELINNGVMDILKVTLKYGPKRTNVITGIRRISKPGLRVYAKADKLPKVLGGLGVAIISTNKGIMTDKQARYGKLGGEVMALVW